jgi:hypothetical protein
MAPRWVRSGTVAADRGLTVSALSISDTLGQLAIGRCRAKIRDAAIVEARRDGPQ